MADAGWTWWLFVYAPDAARDDLLDAEDWRLVELALVRNPFAGPLVPGLGGARKLRIALAGRGKRGGARTIYLFAPEREAIFVLATYAKNERADLSPADQRRLAALIERIKQGRG